ncbi:MAG: hypothetical protein IJ733_05585, partial [Lachnospiraceae bacterium]|nr:hypothetical protein [Lachnospiraceae bacterium]
GLIKCGSVVVPFDNTIGKDTDLYRLYNTNIHEKIAEGLIGYGENADREQADEDFSTELGAEISGLMESGYENGVEKDTSGFDSGFDSGFSEPYAYEDDTDMQDTKDFARISANVREMVRREQAESRDSVPKMGLIREPDFAEDDAKEESGPSGREGQTYSKAYLDRVFEEELKKSRERRMQTGTDSGNNWMIYG